MVIQCGLNIAPQLMEKLEPIKETNDVSKILEELSEISFRNTKFDKNHTITLDKYLDEYDKILFNVDILNEFIHHLGKSNHKESGYITDIHADNVMMRNNKLVLVDPFSY